MIVGNPLAAALPGRDARAPQRAFDPQAVARLDRDALARRDAPRCQGRPEDGRPGVGDLPRACAVRRDPRDGQQPQVLRPRLALADGRQPRPVRQPADGPPDAIPGRDPLRLRRRRDGSRGLGRTPATALRRGARRPGCARSGRSVRRGLRCARRACHPATAAARSRAFPMARRARASHRSGRCGRGRPASAGRPGTNRRRRTRRRATRRAASSRRCRGCARRRRPCWPRLRRPRPRSARYPGRRGIAGPSRRCGHRRATIACASTSMPLAVSAVGLRRARLALRAAATRDRRIDEPDLGPAPAARQEREATTVR